VVPDALKVYTQPKLSNATMILGFGGWMDGGDVSTGTIDWLVNKLKAQPLAEIESGSFYIYNFPGPMELAALFRPHADIEDGILTSFELPRNTFYVSEEHNLVLFKGREPNINWEAYADCMFALASVCDVTMIYFVGSVAGVVPHTRDPWLATSVSDRKLKARLQEYGLRFTNYAGPASFITLLLKLAPERGVQMATLVAEVPAYVQGKNPRCIEAVLRKLAGILGLKLDLEDLRTVSDNFEKKVNEVVAEKSDLVELIQKLESDYDNKVLDTQMGDLKDWLQERGISLD